MLTLPPTGLLGCHVSSPPDILYEFLTPGVSPPHTNGSHLYLAVPASVRPSEDKMIGDGLKISKD